LKASNYFDFFNDADYLNLSTTTKSNINIPNNNNFIDLVFYSKNETEDNFDKYTWLITENARFIIQIFLYINFKCTVYCLFFYVKEIFVLEITLLYNVLVMIINTISFFFVVL
jgi:hypothetical protein